LGLDFREYAFYSALEVNDTSVAVLGDEILKHIARELVDSVKSNTTIDWTVRGNVQAKMRVAIKKILRKYDYPPGMRVKAVETVIEQAKLLANDFSSKFYEQGGDTYSIAADI
jgi:type I restriction enzyme R subunit